MKSLLSMFLCLFSLNIAFASQGDHDHADENFPEDALLILEGADAIDQTECFLFVLETGFNGSASSQNYYLKVQSSYVHGTEASPAFVLTKHSKNADTYMGTTGQDSLAVVFKSNSIDPREIKQFSIRWLHGSHYHTNRCQDLKPHQH
ncbi:MAG: hypothetical protein ACLGGX_05175 [Bdellovibrionia bacterium]